MRIPNQRALRIRAVRFAAELVEHCEVPCWVKPVKGSEPRKRPLTTCLRGTVEVPRLINNQAPRWPLRLPVKPALENVEDVLIAVFVQPKHHSGTARPFFRHAIEVPRRVQCQTRGGEPSVRAVETEQDALVSVFVHLENGAVVTSTASGCSIEVAFRVLNQGGFWKLSIRRPFE
jgi:hypothetical protein